MLSLVQATQLSRVFIKKGTFALVILILVIFAINGLIALKKALTPSGPPPAEENFGTLPKVPFPPAKQAITYTLNTVTGVLPILPDRIKVYKMKSRSPNLLDLNNIRISLRKVGFSQEETKLDEVIYQWKNFQGDPDTFIKYNILTSAFQIHSSFLENPNVLSAKNLPGNNTAQDIGLGFLRGIGEDISGFDLSKTRYTYYKIENIKLKQVEALNEAHIVKVEFFPKQLNKLDIYYSDYLNDSVASFLIASGKYTPVIINANFIRQQTEPENPLFFSTYLIKSASQAFEDLKNGNAHVFNPYNNSRVEITDITIGYYIQHTTISQPLQEYIIPIIVFTGKNFKAYVHALPDTKFR